MPLNFKDNKLLDKKRAGVLLPLSSMRSAGDWGCGDMASFGEWIKYLSSQGAQIIQVLPLHETAPGVDCPYSALSAFAIDPLYISISDVPDVKNSPKAQEILQDLQDDIDFWRSQDTTQFKYIKSAKYKVLWAAYEDLILSGKARDLRYQEFLSFQNKNGFWLTPYCLFRTAKDLSGWTCWRNWERDLSSTNVAYLKDFAARYEAQIGFFSYLQWILQQQLASARAIAEQNKMLIFGDIPYGVNFDSADVWAAQSNYLLNAEVGAPKDQFSKGGQKWGLPAYNWPVIEQNNFNLWRAKIKRACEIYDIFRLDHLVGFFRMWMFENGDETGRFDLVGEDKQKARGYKFLEAVTQSAGEKLPVGEDLGVIPDYMRAMMKEICLPGYRVLRWEKDNEVFREPRNYPFYSLATTSTHDTDTLKEWWDSMEKWQRANIWEMISAQKTDGNVPFSEDTHKAILQRVMQSGSSMVIFPIQDIIGEGGRINTPGTVSEDNWTYRVPLEPSSFHEKYQKKMELFKQLIQESGRS